MKKTGILFFVVMALAACSGEQGGTATKEGWTSQQIADSRTECTNKLRPTDGEEVANKFCTCLFDKASKQVTFADYSANPNTPETIKILSDIQTECDKAL